jgi:DNA-binding NarL/FixJ family response regulator
MQQSLRTSLSACEGVAVTASLGDGLSALNHAAEHKPCLLVIDCNLLEEEVAALLEGIRLRHLPTRCLVLIRTQRQSHWALEAGADAAWLRDGSFQELQAVLAQLSADYWAQTTGHGPDTMVYGKGIE